MIIEVRTRTVGYKACVKNSLSFSILPTKPFPRLKDRAPARGADSMGAVPQPTGNHAPEQTAFSVVVKLNLHYHHWVPLIQATKLFFFFRSQVTRVMHVKCIDLRMETTKWGSALGTSYFLRGSSSPTEHPLLCAWLEQTGHPGIQLKCRYKQRLNHKEIWEETVAPDENSNSSIWDIIHFII